mgnify:CR=1 FL=1
MDSLLVAFTKKYVHILNDKDLICLSNLLDIDDENLFIFENSLSFETTDFQNHKFKKIDSHVLIIGKTFGHLDQTAFLREIYNKIEGPPPEINLSNEKKDITQYGTNHYSKFT